LVAVQKKEQVRNFLDKGQALVSANGIL
jgi:hypothetical protein